MKTCFLVGVLSLVGLLLPALSHADDGPFACESSLTSAELELWTHQFVPRGSNGRPPAAAFYLVDEGGNVEKELYSLNHHHAQAVASTQKMITVYTAYRMGSLSRPVTWTHLDKTYDLEGDPAFLESTGQAPQFGERSPATQYLESLIRNSSNGAALAISQSLPSGSTEEFVGRMNQMARSLIGDPSNAFQTFFQNPAGLTDSGGSYNFTASIERQRSTADNMARLMGKIMSDSGFRSMMAKNGLSNFASGIVVKPGQTHAAGDTEIVYVPLPHCSRKAIAYAIFGEERDSQWARFRSLLANIRAAVGYSPVQ